MTTGGKKSPRVRRGRPTLGPDEGKRSILNARITKELRSRLENDAAAAGRSLSQEIELQLERAYWTTDQELATWGGKATYALLRLFATAALIIQRPSRPFPDNPDTTIRLRAAIDAIMDAVMPTGDPSESVQDLQILGRETARLILEGGLAEDMLYDPSKDKRRRTILTEHIKTPLTGALVPSRKK